MATVRKCRDLRLDAPELTQGFLEARLGQGGKAKVARASKKAQQEGERIYGKKNGRGRAAVLDGKMAVQARAMTG